MPLQRTLGKLLAPLILEKGTCTRPMEKLQERKERLIARRRAARARITAREAKAMKRRIRRRECAYYLMNWSDNTAWAMLTRYLGIEAVQADLYSIGADDTAYWEPNTTTAGDVLLMLKKIADPSFASSDLSEEMLASMTDTDFEDRIPGGLPPDVRAAQDRQLREQL